MNPIASDAGRIGDASRINSEKPLDLNDNNAGNEFSESPRDVEQLKSVFNELRFWCDINAPVKWDETRKTYQVTTA